MAPRARPQRLQPVRDPGRATGASRAAPPLSLALGLALSACAAAVPTLQPAHGIVASGPGTREKVWALAVAAIRDRDDEIALGDPVRGILVTRERERELPCGPRICRTREILHLRLDEGRVAVRLDRRFVDAQGTWSPPTDPTDVASAVAEERALLQRLAASRIEIRAGRVGEGCSADPDCELGLGCVQRRCVKLRQR